MRILFLLRANGNYNTNTSKSGLLNSARMTKDALEASFKVETKLEIVVDSNEIDKHVTQFKPDVCILEAIWVTAEKMQELTKIHKRVKFVIRVHSETPFLANEGVAIERIKSLSKIRNVKIAFNSFETARDFAYAGVDEEGLYLPNIYDINYSPERLDELYIYKAKHDKEKHRRTINIGCFGAIRPMKNQLLQAMAAIELANAIKAKLRFHINSSRLEQGGESVYKNIKALFTDSVHELVEHSWMERAEFLNLISKMDIGMQLSFNESFNIVTADFVKQNIPILAGYSIKWMPDESTSNPEDQRSAVLNMLKILDNPKQYVLKNKKALKEYNKKALFIWKIFIKLND